MYKGRKFNKGRRRPQRENRINEDIWEKQVRLIVPEGQPIIIDTREAIQKAKEIGEDLVEITKSKGQELPIVKIISYGKFKFEKAKKDKENKKNKKIGQLKEVKIGPKIDVGDFNRKRDNAKDFLLDGDTVKVSMRFRGREMAHTDLGREKMIQFRDELIDVANPDKAPKLEGRVMSMVLRPKSQKK